MKTSLDTVTVPPLLFHLKDLLMTASRGKPNSFSQRGLDEATRVSLNAQALKSEDGANVAPGQPALVAL